jgi:hypothetical protein
VQGNFTPRFIDPFNITEEREEELKPSFQVSFPIRLNLGDEIHLKGVGLSHPDEDITPLDTNNNPPLNVQGPITRARARQLNLEVS